MVTFAGIDGVLGLIINSMVLRSIFLLTGNPHLNLEMAAGFLVAGVGLGNPLHFLIYIFDYQQRKGGFVQSEIAFFSF